MNHPWDDPLKYRTGEPLSSLVDWREPVGLGAGSTIQAAAKYIYDNGIYRGAPVACGSEETEEIARGLGMKVVPREELGLSYTYIDGTDQFDPDFNLIKGGFKNTGNPGQEGCMLREKMLASNARNFIVVCDDTKEAPYLGCRGLGLPVEFNPANKQTVRLGLSDIFSFRNSELSRRKGPDWDDFITENGHMIYDLPFDARDFEDLGSLEYDIKSRAGVIETGLFAIDRPSNIVLSGKNGIQILERPR